VFKIEGGGGLGLTYVTGALVKVGQYLAVAVAGGDRLSWVPNFLLCGAGRGRGMWRGRLSLDQPRRDLVCRRRRAGLERHRRRDDSSLRRVGFD
jgi:hypothetical protein